MSTQLLHRNTSCACGVSCEWRAHKTVRLRLRLRLRLRWTHASADQSIESAARRIGRRAHEGDRTHTRSWQALLANCDAGGGGGEGRGGEECSGVESSQREPLCALYSLSLRNLASPKSAIFAVLLSPTRMFLRESIVSAHGSEQ